MTRQMAFLSYMGIACKYVPIVYIMFAWIYSLTNRNFSVIAFKIHTFEQ